MQMLTAKTGLKTDLCTACAHACHSNTKYYYSLSTYKHGQYVLYGAQNIQDVLQATQPSRHLETANAYFTTGGSGCAEIIIDMLLLKPLAHIFLIQLGLRYTVSWKILKTSIAAITRLLPTSAQHSRPFI